MKIRITLVIVTANLTQVILFTTLIYYENPLYRFRIISVKNITLLIAPPSRARLDDYTSLISNYDHG